MKVGWGVREAAVAVLPIAVGPETIVRRGRVDRSRVGMFRRGKVVRRGDEVRARNNNSMIAAMRMREVRGGGWLGVKRLLGCSTVSRVSVRGEQGYWFGGGMKRRPGCCVGFGGCGGGRLDSG